MVEIKSLQILKVKKHFDFVELEQKGDWIDLPFCGIHPSQINKFKDYEVDENFKTFYFKKDTYTILNLGVSIKLPDGFEAHLLPRSSLFLKKGILLGNSMGIIDNAYCGNDDVWGFIAYFTRDTELKVGERIAQFRIERNMSSLYDIKIEFVEDLTKNNRGGFGSTGE